MGHDPELPESDQTREPPEEPPSFQPDAAFANQDRNGGPSEDEVRKVAKAQSR